ncbi:MAG: sensor histidine kinase, partial [Lachnospiraceae bacterium]|nr:sensor histidine kinase [Lachnospiraceae bacterium]
KYMTRLKAQLDESALLESVKSGNPITDIIISEKQKAAEKKGIDFKYEFYYPENTKLNAFDISVILNNAINNAIEAAVECENPFVKILSYRKNGVYMIEIHNSITGNRVIDSYNGLPVTTKSGEGHGFGLVNVKKVAQKYYGDIDIEQSGNEFILVVMLMVE